MPIYPIVVFYDEYPAAQQPQLYSIGLSGISGGDVNALALQADGKTRNNQPKAAIAA